MLWCGESDTAESKNCSWIISPIFFEDTINSECYCKLLLYLFIGYLNEYIACGYFQQDGATAYLAHISMGVWGWL